MSATASVIIVSPDGENTLAIFAESEAMFRFDPTDDGAEFSIDQVLYAIEVLKEIVPK